MIWFRRVCMAVGVTAALTVFAAPALAQQVTYSLAGVETAASSTEGTFVGVALSPGDFGTWGAVIQHTPLDDVALITGGSFAIDGQVHNLQGTINPGGAIIKLGGSCRKETFAVSGNVTLVGDEAGGTGVFNVKLTHYGLRVPGGSCFTFFATVEGLITFTLP